MLILKLYDLMIKGYDQLEVALLNNGMSAAATDFMMIGTGFLLLAFIALAAIAMIGLYGILIAASYIRMIHLKNIADRRKWSIIFIITLMIVIADLVLIIT